MLFEILDTIFWFIIGKHTGDYVERKNREYYPEEMKRFDEHMKNEPVHKFFKKFF